MADRKRSILLRGAVVALDSDAEIDEKPSDCEWALQAAKLRNHRGGAVDAFHESRVGNGVYRLCFCCGKHLDSLEGCLIDISPTIGPTACPAACAARYCSQACLKFDQEENGHGFICAGQKDRLASQFRRFTEQSKLSVSLSLAAKVLSRLVCKSLRASNANSQVKLSTSLRDQLELFTASYPVLEPVNEDQEDDALESDIEDSHALFSAMLLSEKFPKHQLHTELGNAYLSEVGLSEWRRLVAAIQLYHCSVLVDSPALRVAQSLPSVFPLRRRHAKLKALCRFLGNEVDMDDTSLATIQSSERVLTRLASHVSSPTSESAAVSDTVGKIVAPLVSAIRDRSVVVNVLHFSFPSLPHSCTPTAVVEHALNSSNSSPILRVQLVALTDIQPCEKISLSYLPWHLSNQSFHDRQVCLSERRLLRALKRACVCVCPRCTIENSEARSSKRLKPSIEMSLVEALRAAGSFMQENTQTSFARAVEILNHELNNFRDGCALAPELNSLIGDLFHALGACYLSMQQWWEAHALWREGARLCPGSSVLKDTVAKLDAFPSLRLALSSKGLQSCYTPVSTARHDSPMIFLSSKPWLSDAQCAWIVSEAEAYASKQGGWTTSRHYAVPTTDLPVRDIPSLANFFSTMLSEEVAPTLGALFQSQASSPAYCDVSVHDLFVAKYSQDIKDEALKDFDLNAAAARDPTEQSSQQRFLPLHSDESSHSFVVALSNRDAYLGGGTYFVDTETALVPEQGHAVIFNGQLLHGGEPVLLGCRYIIAGFMLLRYSGDTAQKRDIDFKSEGNPSFCFEFELDA